MLWDPSLRALALFGLLQIGVLLALTMSAALSRGAAPGPRRHDAHGHDAHGHGLPAHGACRSRDTHRAHSRPPRPRTRLTRRHHGLQGNPGSPRPTSASGCTCPSCCKGLAITTRHFLRNLFGTRDTNPQRGGPQGHQPRHHGAVPRGEGRLPARATAACTGWCRATTASRAAWPATCAPPSARRSASTSRRASTRRATAEAESRVIEKFPTQFVIDELRCIVCGLCVDACPKDAIRMDTYTHTPPEYNRQGFVYDIPKLLKGPAGLAPVRPRGTSASGSEEPAPRAQGSPHAHRRGPVAQPRHELTAGHGHGEHATPASRTVVSNEGPVPVTKFLK